MITIKDSMILIHLAKMSILGESCRYFGDVLIPKNVYHETVTSGREKGHPDAVVIEQAIDENLIKIKEGQDKKKVDNLRLFGLHYGEAEAVALYYQENARFLATDDDTCRKNRIILDINIIGSPAIVIMLYRKGIISKDKVIDCVSSLEEIGWFDANILYEMSQQIEMR